MSLTRKLVTVATIATFSLTTLLAKEPTKNIHKGPQIIESYQVNDWNMTKANTTGITYETIKRNYKNNILKGSFKAYDWGLLKYKGATIGCETIRKAIKRRTLENITSATKTDYTTHSILLTKKETQN